MARQHTHSSFKTVEEILNSENDFANLRESLKNYRVVDEFEKIFPDLKSIAQAVRVEKNVLYLRVENSVWKSELNFNKNVIVEKINKHYSLSIIKTIKFL
jgi:hypothetical protein